MSSNVAVTNREDEELDYEDELTENTDVTEETDSTQFDKKIKEKRKTKGRGFKESGNVDERYSGRAGKYESLKGDGKTGVPHQKSVEGWILCVTGIHEEAQEDDVYDLFSEYGEVKHLHLNLDRRTGYVKGYALVEFEKFQEAEDAVNALNGAQLLERSITVDFAFRKPSKSKK
mmetsp:Transcript_24848/g.59768  ORF Transcript_24848/g.59768 Transcript_24848/m.59768 type:complete len:174 (-) Transcript_24848:55-576(-)|eukprot:CAMPEP_0114505808 /NCGR_PEP_ID=MMETSP0109-20121206/11059_1 /TAXON_ID=29199 /ORGANISM="Chlorarachnion reptans, Strain CCCM449" /LENGTH=173 /DNA_ID=CAMNT_0001684289 /DNA_START=76 /DNA_END=597 /DNA_ORIENTATION=+